VDGKLSLRKEKQNLGQHDFGKKKYVWTEHKFLSSHEKRAVG
jgi:hypothetical protein